MGRQVASENELGSRFSKFLIALRINEQKLHFRNTDLCYINL